METLFHRTKHITYSISYVDDIIELDKKRKGVSVYMTDKHEETLRRNGWEISYAGRPHAWRFRE
jgi:hypothetical protein